MSLGYPKWLGVRIPSKPSRSPWLQHSSHQGINSSYMNQEQPTRKWASGTSLGLGPCKLQLLQKATETNIMWVETNLRKWIENHNIHQICPLNLLSHFPGVPDPSILSNMKIPLSSSPTIFHLSIFTSICCFLACTWHPQNIRSEGVIFDCLWCDPWQSLNHTLSAIVVPRWLYRKEMEWR